MHGVVPIDLTGKPDPTCGRLGRSPRYNCGRWRGLASPFRRHLVAAPADSKLPTGVALPAYTQWRQTWALQKH
jgi:hypothetical protein